MEGFRSQEKTRATGGAESDWNKIGVRGIQNIEFRIQKKRRSVQIVSLAAEPQPKRKKNVEVRKIRNGKSQTNHELGFFDQRALSQSS